MEQYNGGGSSPNGNNDYSSYQFRPGANNPNQNYGYGNAFYTQPVITPELRAKKAIKSAAVTVGLALMIFIAMQFAVSFIYVFMISAFQISWAEDSVEYRIFNLIQYVLMFAVPSIVIMIIKNAKGEKLFSLFGDKNAAQEVKEELKKSRVRDYVCLSFFVLATTFAGLFISNYLEAFINSLGFATNEALFIMEYENIWARLIYAAVVCICAPIFEELLFRGVILHSLRRFGDTFAITCSAILFGLMHNNIQQIPHAVIGGLLFGYIVVKRGNLISSIILHAVNNIFVTVLDFLIAADVTGISDELGIVIQYGVILVIVAIAFILFFYYNKKNTFKLDKDIETSLGKKADAFLPGLTSYKVFFSNPLIIIFLAITAVSIISTLEPIVLAELVA